MEIPHRELATAAAASLVLTNLKRQLNDLAAPSHKLEAAIFPVFGIRWDRSVIRKIGSKMLTELLCSLRNSKLSASSYNRVRDLWVSALTNDSSFPPAWEPWRSLIERFNLDDETTWDTWFQVVDDMVKRGWVTPSHLAVIDHQTLSATSSSKPLFEKYFLLWKAAALVYSNATSGAHLVLLGASTNAETLLHRLKATSLVDSAVRNDVNEALSKIRLPKEFENLGPTAKLDKLRKASVNKTKIRTFFRTASQAHSLIGVRFCFRSFSSAIRCYFSFCELRDTTPFPVREEVVIEWSSIFNHGGTYKNYLNYLGKACFYLNSPTTWMTPAVRNISKGLSLLAKSRFRFPNFIDISLLTKIITAETEHSEFAQLSYISFLYALRVPSETLTLVRAFKHDPLDCFSPMKDQALIALRGNKGDERLTLRFSRRKNLPQGCILAMPCFCKLQNVSAHKLCPVHYFWPLIRARTKSGQKLFPSYTATSVNTTIKAVLRKLGVEHANSYSSHGFRRGAANELKTTGSQWSTVAKAGGWQSLAFRGYLDLTQELDRDMSKLLIEATKIDSDLEEVVQHWVWCTKSLSRSMGISAPQSSESDISSCLLGLSPF